MDEPTSALSEKEAEHLLGLVKKLRNTGIGVIYISHRLDELFHIADRVVVMRDGEVTAVHNVGEVEKATLIQEMVGRTVEAFYPKRFIEKKETVLEVKGLSTSYLNDISFYVKKGEVLGVFGLMGAGRSELARCIMGIDKTSAGEILVEGAPVSIRRPIDAIRKGIAYVTAERKKDGLILIQSVKDNIMTASIDRYSKPYRINAKKESEISHGWKDKLSIKTPDISTVVNNLSGGNQQKVVLAKWLTTAPKMLILNEPTRGIDVGAKSEIYKLMEDFCEDGLGVVMISSELQEILQLADRVIIICEGRLTGEYTKEEMTQEKLMRCAVGEARE